MKELLKDGFKLSGTTFDTFKSAVDTVANATKSIVTKGVDVTLLSFCDKKDERSDERNLFYVLNRLYIDAFLNSKGLKLGSISKTEFDEDIFEEMKKTSGLCAIIDGKKFLISSDALATLTMRTGVSGERTVARNNVIRDMHFADALTSTSELTKFIYREEDGQKKIFSCLSKNFNEIPMRILYDALDLVADEKILGKMNVKYWEITHSFTDIYVEFPEAAEEFQSTYGLKDKLIPGLFLCSSDVGASSVIVRGTYRYKNQYIITDEVARKHSGEITIEELLELINTEIFAKVRLLPEKLMDLIGQEVVDYSVNDLSTEAGQIVNYNAVSSVIKKIVNGPLKSALSKKRRVSLEDCMIDEINTTIPYTLYDIAVSFLGAPDRINGLDKATMAAFKKACATVPFNIEKTLKANVEEDDILYLI